MSDFEDIRNFLESVNKGSFSDGFHQPSKARRVSNAISETVRAAVQGEILGQVPLRRLTRFIDEGPAEGEPSGYKEILPTGSATPTSIIWWETSSKLKKIVEKTITYTGALPTTIVWKVYDDTDGTTVLTTITDTIVYSGAIESTRTRVIA